MPNEKEASYPLITLCMLVIFVCMVVITLGGCALIIDAINFFDIKDVSIVASISLTVCGSVLILNAITLSGIFKILANTDRIADEIRNIVCGIGITFLGIGLIISDIDSIVGGINSICDVSYTIVGRMIKRENYWLFPVAILLSGVALMVGRIIKIAMDTGFTKLIGPTACGTTLIICGVTLMVGDIGETATMVLGIITIVIGIGIVLRNIAFIVSIIKDVVKNE